MQLEQHSEFIASQFEICLDETRQVYKDNIHLLTEAQEMGTEKEKTNLNVLNYVSIDVLKECIIDELNELAEKHGEFYKPDPLLVSMQ